MLAGWLYTYNVVVRCGFFQSHSKWSRILHMMISFTTSKVQRYWVVHQSQIYGTN